MSRNPRAGGRVDLMLTGGFTSKLATRRLGRRKFLFTSSDKKTPRLVRKYGIDIMGLSEKRWNQRQREYVPKLSRVVKRVLFG